jgi:hypothetical protein
MKTKTKLICAISIAYAILESVWASILLDRLLKVFFPQTFFNYFLLLGISAAALNAFDLFCKCDSELRTALRVNTFIWLIIITLVEFSIEIL